MCCRWTTCHISRPSHFLKRTSSPEVLPFAEARLPEAASILQMKAGLPSLCRSPLCARSPQVALSAPPDSLGEGFLGHGNGEQQQLLGQGNEESSLPLDTCLGMQLAQRKVGWVHCGEQPRAPMVWGSPAGETGGRRGGGNPSRGQQTGWWLGERGVGVGMNQTFPQEQRRGQGKNPGGRVEAGWLPGMLK